MKKLSTKDLDKLDIHNPHYFAWGAFYVSFVPSTRQTMGSFGWWVHVPKRPNTADGPFSRGYRIRGYESGKVHPSELVELPNVLTSLGYTMPEGWVKYLGAWIPADYFEKRTAYLVGKLKELKEENRGVKE